MRTRYKAVEDGQPIFITSTIVEWIPVFIRKPYIDILINALTFCRQNKKLKIFSYVIMDNHIHLLISGDNLSNIIRDFKRHTAREIIKLAEFEKKFWLLQQFKFYRQKYKTDSDYQVWQEGFHPKQIFSEDMLRQKIEYIHHNPVRIGWVDKPEDWVYSSARNYLGLEAILEIDALEI
ncbi:MAG: transposase [Deltaproteobacteria bacterium]|nr:transposase [Deltaproteobacteria bacterium]MBI4795569.1 transposase [Deltaproteobacteria bacterium]